MQNGARIIISRTDSIGDVVLTLPMAGVLKQKDPECVVLFLGRSYTRDVVALSEHVDKFLNYDVIKEMPLEEQIQFMKDQKADVIFHVYPKKEIALLAEQSQIPVRIGTLSRLYHWYTCNRKLHLPRKNSKLHEAQLNLKMLSALGLPTFWDLKEISTFYGFSKVSELDPKFKSLLDSDRCNLILHPKSKGSAREWGLDNFQKLVELLPEEKFKVFISGTAQDGESMNTWIHQNPRLHDLTGKMNLKEFISFIAASDALVAASTGPLHLAAALGKKTIGLYAPMRPIHPGRWQPLGPNASALVLNKNCDDCRKTADCHCIQEIKVQEVADLLIKHHGI